MQAIEQGPGRDQVACCEAFREAFVNPAKNVSRFRRSGAALPQPREARRASQLPGQRLLLAADINRPKK